jgi:hypothetical protein
MAKLRSLNAVEKEPFLRSIRDMLNAYYGDSGGKATLSNGKVIFEQAAKPSESAEGFYVRAEIKLGKVQQRG